MIQKRIQTVHQAVFPLEQIISYTKTSWFKDIAPLHRFYKDWFNLVDLADTYWYQVQENHVNIRWKSKMLFAIMRFYTFNCWVWVSSVHFEMWKVFRTQLAKELVQR